MPKDEGYQARSVLLAAPVLSLWAASTQMPPLPISTRLAWLSLPASTYPLVPTICQCLAATGTHLLHCPAVHIVILGAQSCSAYSPVDVHSPAGPTFLRDPHLFQSHLPVRHPCPLPLQ